MPCKAEKKDKPIKGDEAEELILQYLKSVNRPYASTDVSVNLKGKVPKPAAQKILVALAEKGSLTMKPYGKQTIFVYNQSTLPVLDPNEVASLDADLKKAQEDVEGKRKELKGVQNELTAKETEPKTKDLAREIERIKAENELSLKSLRMHRGESNAAPPLSAADAKRIDDEWTKWRKEWTSRRKVYKELLGIIGDGGVYVNVDEFEEGMGVEKDDDDAVQVERGEFCAPPGKKVSGKPGMGVVGAKVTGVGAGVGAVGAGAKRLSSQVSGEGEKKKRSKGK